MTTRQLAQHLGVPVSIVAITLAHIEAPELQRVLVGFDDQIPAGGYELAAAAVIIQSMQIKIDRLTEKILRLID